MSATWRTTVLACVTVAALTVLQALGKLDGGTLSAISGVFAAVVARHTVQDRQGKGTP